MNKKLFLILNFSAFLLGNLSAECTDERCSAISVNEEIVEYETIVNSDSFYNVYTESPTIFTWRAPGEYFWKYAIELRVGGNQPSNSRVLKTYGRMIEYEIEWTSRQCFRELDGWVNISYLSHSGHYHEKSHHHHKNLFHHHEEHSKKKTRLRLYPVSFGLKRTFYLSDNFYLCAGLGACSANVQGDFFSDHRHVHKQAWGAVAKGGILYDFNCGIYFDVFCDYYYLPLMSRGDTLNVGGVRAGFGMGLNY